MIMKRIDLKSETKDADYTTLCNTMTKQGVFKACGNCDEKWVIGKWEDDIDFLAWSVAMGLGKLVPSPTII